MSDYVSFDFKGYFVSGDLLDKDLAVYVSAALPTTTTPFHNGGTPAGLIHRVGEGEGASTAWESFRIPLDGLDATTGALTGEVFFAFGSNNSGQVYYVDDIALNVEPMPAVP